VTSDSRQQQRALDNPITPPSADRGYRKLFLQSVTKADQGVDFDFLRAPETKGLVPRK